MEKQPKLFAFELVKKQNDKPATQWQAREGVSVAGCSDPTHDGNWREPNRLGQNDKGIYC